MLKPIINTQKGERISIQCLSCSRDECCQLQELGCMIGACAKVLSNNKRVIIEIRGTRLGISAKLAQTIMVSPIGRE